MDEIDFYGKDLERHKRIVRGCKKCGAKRRLTFHHKRPSEKLFDISSGLRDWEIDLELFIAELDKCDVLCEKCHILVHAVGAPLGPAGSKKARRKEVLKIKGMKIGRNRIR